MSRPPSTDGASAWWERPWVILLAATLVRIAALFLLEGDTNDGTTRIGTATDWFFRGAPTFGRTVWAEGNYVLPGLALLVWRDPFWSVRLLYALVAAANVWVVVRLTAAAFDRRAAAVAGWIVALMPFHIYTSINGATSEAPYVLFTLASVLAIVRYRERPSVGWAAAAGVTLAIATSIRYDGVIWGLPLAAAMVLWRPGERRAVRIDAPTIGHLAVFGVLGLTYIAVIFARWASLYDSPMYPLDQAKLNTLQFFADGGHQRWPAWLYQSYVVLFWPGATAVILTPVVALLAWLGVVGAAAERERRALPLALGVLVGMAWLAYAAFTHSILAQFRYALVLAVVLAAFVVPGARWIRRRLPRVSARTLVAAAAVGAVAWQAIMADAALHERGVLTNQFAAMSLLRRSQFAARDVLRWAAAHATREAPLVVTPHVDSPYYALKKAPLVAGGQVVSQGYYLPKSQLIHTRRSLEAELASRIAAAGWVATSTGTRTLGLRDGIQLELVRPKRTADGWAWRGIALERREHFGDVQLWRVVRPAPAGAAALTPTASTSR